MFRGLRPLSRPLLTAAFVAALPPPAPPRAESPTEGDYSSLGYGADLYLRSGTVKASDLPILVKKWKEGQDTWPWVWCQRNPNGVSDAGGG